VVAQRLGNNQTWEGSKKLLFEDMMRAMGVTHPPSATNPGTIVLTVATDDMKNKEVGPSASPHRADDAAADQSW